jgi:excisionase family DNA binding protein
MSDKVLVAVPGLGVLALELETYRQALADGASLVGAAGAAAAAESEPWLDAGKLAEQLKVPVTQIESGARRGTIPGARVGRYWRFQRSAVERALAANGKGARA